MVWLSHDYDVGLDPLDRLVWEDLDSGEAALVLNLDVFTCARHVYEAHPAAHCVLPAHDRVSNQRVGLDHCVAENG